MDNANCEDKNHIEILVYDILTALIFRRIFRVRIKKRLFGLAMLCYLASSYRISDVGVVAEIEYIDKTHIGPRYLTALSARIKGAPCAFVGLSAS